MIKQIGGLNERLNSRGCALVYNNVYGGVFYNITNGDIKGNILFIG